MSEDAPPYGHPPPTPGNYDDSISSALEELRSVPGKSLSTVLGVIRFALDQGLGLEDLRAAVELAEKRALAPRANWDAEFARERCSNRMRK
jgi:hypothetical protein